MIRATRGAAERRLGRAEMAAADGAWHHRTGSRDKGVLVRTPERERAGNQQVGAARFEPSMSGDAARGRRRL